MAEIQVQREILNQSERHAFEEFLEDSKISSDNDDDDDPTVMTKLKQNFTGMWRGPAFNRKEIFSLE